MTKKNNTPNNNYGQVYLPILTNTEQKLNVTERVVYALLAVKQGNSDEAHLTQTQIADSLSLSISTVKRVFNKLKAAGIIQPADDKGWKVIQPDLINQYGNVEQIVLGTPSISNTAKLLYSYYIVVTAGVATCTRSAATITADLKIGEGSYHKAYKELVDNTLIATGKRNTTNGYVNVVAPKRLEKANPKDFLPASWFKEDDVLLDTSDVNFYEVAARINAKAKVSKSRDVSVNSNGLKVSFQGDIGKQSKGMNINHNINQDINPNSKPDLAGSTAVPEVHVFGTSPKFHDYTFNPELVTVEDKDKINLINIFFSVLRNYANRLDWRMTNLDFDRIDSCMNDLNLLDAERADNYLNFLKTEILPNRPKANSFAYYVSEGIKEVYIAYNSAMEFGSEFSLDDRTMRYNYEGAL